MKNIVNGIVFIALLVFAIPSHAMMPEVYTYSNGGFRRATPCEISRTNFVKVPPQAKPVTRVIVNTPDYNSRVVVTPPPPPPRRETYHYSGSTGNQRYPRRNYYVPSYCQPLSKVQNNRNPFCAQYMPYGNSNYLRF